MFYIDNVIFYILDVILVKFLSLKSYILIIISLNITKNIIKQIGSLSFISKIENFY